MNENTTKLGKKYSLKIQRFVDFGCYIDGNELGEILLPIKFIPKDKKEGDEVDVFIYKDSENRIIATTENAKIEVGQFGAMEVKAVNKVGAFLDWGINKDLMVPFIEQQHKMEVGKIYLVFAYIDTDTDRVAASSRLNQFLTLAPPNYEVGQEVDIIVATKTDLGFKTIINKSHWGLIYDNQIFEKIKIGDCRKAYISKIRNDDKIDLTLNKFGMQHIDSASQIILDALKKDNCIPLHDKSSTEEIQERFKISKKAFKKAIGILYKQRLIIIGENEIRLA